MTRKSLLSVSCKYSLGRFLRFFKADKALKKLPLPSSLDASLSKMPLGLDFISQIYCKYARVRTVKIRNLCGLFFYRLYLAIYKLLR